jgi:hypothetical protein
MSDELTARFAAHQIARQDLHALVVRSDGPALLRAAWHFGTLAVTGTLV